MENDLFREIRVALASYAGEDFDSDDRDQAARDVLEAIRGATPEQIEAAIGAHPAPARLSPDEYLEILRQRKERFLRQAAVRP